MNFPLQEPVYHFLYWLVNTPGLGGVAMVGIFALCVAAFGSALGWIARGARADEPAEYPYPTSALHKK